MYVDAYNISEKNEFFFYNFLFISSASRPAYERTSEESSVFNAALRNALEKRAPINDLFDKVLKCKIDTIILETSVHQYQVQSLFSI